MLSRYVEAINDGMDANGTISPQTLEHIQKTTPAEEFSALSAAVNWIRLGGMRSVFVQDADSLVIKPAELEEILRHLKHSFPDVERITSYARSHTLARMEAKALHDLHLAGLNRIHVGLESGSDMVLKRIRKGSTKQEHVEAGRKVKDAGIELSEYVMPGLGGKDLSQEHALETADALNRIDPDFIRLRTLGLPQRAPLYEAWEAGTFERCTDMEVVEEIQIMVENLDGLHSHLFSDHIVNLLGNLEGRFPRDKGRLIKILTDFSSLDTETRCVYQLGRRLGLLSSLEDMENPRRRARIEQVRSEAGITPENIESFTAEMMRRFV